MKKEINKNNQIAVFQAKTGAIELKKDAVKETIWATQAQMAAIFGVNSQAITKHLKNIYQDGELSKKATCSKMEQVQIEGSRSVKRSLDLYNLDAIISVGYRISSKMGTKFRQWATKTLREHIAKGYTINPSRIKNNYAEFQKALESIKKLLPEAGQIGAESALELISAFADTWLSLEAYDKDKMAKVGQTKKTVVLTSEKLNLALADFKVELLKKGEATDLFGAERQKDSIAGIVGNVMQSFAGRPLYPSIEEKAAHLLYFVVKNHPFVDGNKRSGAYAFVWFLQKAGILNKSKITPPALTAITLLTAESNPKNKERMIGLILQLLKK